MAIELIPAPERMLKQYSTWVNVIGMVAAAALIGLPTLSDVITTKQAAIAAFFLILIGQGVKAIRQDIPLTEESKVALVNAAKATPIKEEPAF